MEVSDRHNKNVGEEINDIICNYTSTRITLDSSESSFTELCVTSHTKMVLYFRSVQ